MKSPRGQAIELLSQLWTKAKEGIAQMAWLEAGPGLGKSWLVRRWQAEQIQQGYERQVFALKTPILSSLVRSLPQLADENDPAFLAAAKRLAPELSWKLSVQTPVLGQQELRHVVWRAIRRLSQRLGGITLIIEDVHDLASDDLEVLRFLWQQSQIQTAPILWMLSTRPLGEVLLQPTQALRLEVLRPNELETLACEVLRTSYPPPQLAQWLFEHTEGHPLYSTELLRHLIASGVLRQSHAWVFDLSAELALPQGLEAVLQSRLAVAQNDINLWKALAALSILDGSGLGAWVRVSQISRENLLEIAGRGIELGLVRSEMRLGQTFYAVAHPLYPPLIRRKLEEAQKKELHRRAVEVVQQPGPKARHARLSDHPEAAHLTRKALEGAKNRYGYAEAANEAENLLQFDPPDADKLRLERAWDLYYAGQTEAALIEAQHLAGAEAAHIRQKTLIRMGRFAEAKTNILSHIENKDWENTLKIALCDVNLHLGELAEAEGLARELVEQHPTSSIERAKALYTLGDILGSDAQPLTQKRESLGYLLEAIETIRPFNQPQILIAALNLAGSTAGFLGDWETGKARLEEALEIDATQGGAIRAYMLANLSFLLLQQGDYPAAKRAGLESLHIGEVRRDYRLIAAVLWNVGIACLWLGELEEAQKYIRRSIDFGTHEAASSIDLAEVLALNGETQAALETLCGPQNGYYFVHPYSKCRVLLLAGQPQAALEFIQQTDPTSYHAALNGLHHYLWAIALHQTGKTEAALEQLEVALKQVRQVGQAPLEAEIQLAQAILLQDEAQIEGYRNKLKIAPGHLRMLEQLYPKVFSPSKPTTIGNGSFIRTLGTFALEEGGRVVPWKAKKPRELLALLITNYLNGNRPGLTREHLTATLWPDTDEESGHQNFRTNLQRLRKAASGLEIMCDPLGNYTLGSLNADVVQFIEAIQNLEIETALEWYGGTFLPGLDLEPIETLRLHLHKQWRDALHKLAVESPLSRAMGYYQQLLTDDPLDLSVVQALLKISPDMHSFELRQILQQSRQRFHQELGYVPDELMALKP